jgi:transaldolase
VTAGALLFRTGHDRDVPTGVFTQGPVGNHRKKKDSMTKLQRLHAEYGQSAWLDNLTRGYLHDGTLTRMVAAGIRGVTANPTIIARAIGSSVDYDEQLASLTVAGCSIEDAYWELVIADATDALGVLRPLFDSSDHEDGFVSVEVAPDLARQTRATIEAARGLHQRIAEPNLLVKIPATPQGVPAIGALVAEGRNINVTLVFSLSRYAEVLEAYLSGLETFVADGGDPAAVHGVASFFVSRVDVEVDRRLEMIGTAEALALRGSAAIAQAKLAYRMFTETFSGGRWERLESVGANIQRPLWASTSTKNPAYPDTRYVDGLIGPHTVNTLPEPTITAFEDHGHLGTTITADLPAAVEVLRRLATVGIDMDDVGRTLEDDGVTKFQGSFHDLLASLATEPAVPARG